MAGPARASKDAGSKHTVSGMTSHALILPACSIRANMRLFKDALPGQPLPSLTAWILEHQGLLIGSSIMLPIAAILVLLFVRHNQWALTGLAALLIVIFIQDSLTTSALYNPIQGALSGLASPQ